MHSDSDQDVDEARGAPTEQGELTSRSSRLVAQADEELSQTPTSQPRSRLLLSHSATIIRTRIVWRLSSFFSLSRSLTSHLLTYNRRLPTRDVYRCARSTGGCGRVPARRSKLARRRAARRRRCKLEIGIVHSRRVLADILFCFINRATTNRALKRFPRPLKLKLRRRPTRLTTSLRQPSPRRPTATPSQQQQQMPTRTQALLNPPMLTVRFLSTFFRRRRVSEHELTGSSSFSSQRDGSSGHPCC